MSDRYFSSRTSSDIFARDNHTCVYCGKPATLIDHVISWELEVRPHMRMVYPVVSPVISRRKMIPSAYMWLREWNTSLE